MASKLLKIKKRKRNFSQVLENPEKKQKLFLRCLKIERIQNRHGQWSNFHGDGMVMVLFLQRWNRDGFGILSPSLSIVFAGVNHWSNGFSMVLSNLGDIKACIKKLKYTGEFENEGSLVPWHKMTSRIKAIDALFNINFSQILRQEFYNHRHKSMVS